MRALVLFILLAGTVCFSGACKTTTTTAHPLSAIDAYAAALKQKDYSKAYSLMSDSYRREHTKEEFVRLMKESPEDVRQTAQDLTRGKRRVEVSARFLYDELQDELNLVQEDGEWKISGDPLSFYPQDTPLHALRSFVRAVDEKRYDVVLRFVPNRWREEMTEDKVRDQFEGDRREEAKQMMRLLRDNLGNPIEVNTSNNSARMQYGERFEVKFEKEDNVWKIADPQ